MPWPGRGDGTVPGLTGMPVRPVQAQRPALPSVPGLRLVTLLREPLPCCWRCRLRAQCAGLAVVVVLSPV